MSNTLIDRNKDLQKLRHEGYNISVKENHLIVKKIPYVDSNRNIHTDGILVTPLELTIDKTNSPIRNHVIFFSGNHPCNKDGTIMSGITHGQNLNQVIAGVKCDCSFSNKPASGYIDYYDKISSYVDLISAPAKSIDSNITAKVFDLVTNDETTEDTVFLYPNTSISLSGVQDIEDKYKNKKVAIIGLGGTGSFVLDHLAKTEISEIHLFDGDLYLQHNAFRAPGATSTESIKEKLKKTDYYKKVYSVMRKGIESFPYYITESNINKLLDYDFLFINIDSSDTKKIIIEFMLENKLNFIDTGIGLEVTADKKIDGSGSIIFSDQNNQSHVMKKLSFYTDEELLYGSNIQVSDINSLVANLAVMKFKQWLNVYEDTNNYNTFTLNIRWGAVISEEKC